MKKAKAGQKAFVMRARVPQAEMKDYVNPARSKVELSDDEEEEGRKVSAKTTLLLKYNMCCNFH